MILAVLTVTLTMGCSTSFNRQWNKAVAQPIPANGVEGPWMGEWISDVNQHHGKLRCVMTKEEEGKYKAYFHATFWKIFRYSYSTILNGEDLTNMTHFKGEKDLGWLAGGVYRYEGHATPTNFLSTYKSKYDHGTFEMIRPVAQQ